MTYNEVDFYGQKLISTANDTVTPGTLRRGYTAHDAAGNPIVGTYDGVITDIVPLNVTENGTYTAPVGEAYSPVNVDVSGGSVTLQSKSVTPTESQQTVTADSGYDGLSSVIVGAVSSSYVGSGIARRSASDLTASGATVTAPTGYYAQSASKSVAAAAQATPGISVSSGGLVTATATQSAGYVTAGTKSATYQLPVYDGSVQAG